MKEETVDRKRPLVTYVSESERVKIHEGATKFGMTISTYLKTMGTANYVPGIVPNNSVMNCLLELNEEITKMKEIILALSRGPKTLNQIEMVQKSIIKLNEALR